VNGKTIKKKEKEKKKVKAIYGKSISLYPSILAIDIQELEF
jgi:hypothetical protein